jgi:hypothetical protein
MIALSAARLVAEHLADLIHCYGPGEARPRTAVVPT